MPIAMDMSTVYLYSFTRAILEVVVGSEDTEVYQVKANTIVFEHLYSLLINYASSTCLCRYNFNRFKFCVILTWQNYVGKNWSEIVVI